MSEIKITDKSGVKLLTKDKYCTEDINVTLDASNLRGENIKEGVSVLGVTGTLKPGMDGVYTINNGSTLTLNGYTHTSYSDYYISYLKKPVAITYAQSDFPYTFSNGTASVKVGGYASVTVERLDAPNSVYAENLAAENIKKGVNILGYTGTYGPEWETGRLFLGYSDSSEWDHTYLELDLSNAAVGRVYTGSRNQFTESTLMDIIIHYVDVNGNMNRASFTIAGDEPWFEMFWWNGNIKATHMGNTVVNVTGEIVKVGFETTLGDNCFSSYLVVDYELLKC